MDDIVNLNKIISSWDERARVRVHQTLKDNMFDVEKLDFLPEWTPFDKPNDFECFSKELQSDLMTISWLYYNQATIDIERKLVIPFCLEVVSSHAEFYNDHQWRQLLFQTITDESYHVQLTDHASEITKRKRTINLVELPNSNVVSQLEFYLSKFNHSWEKQLIVLFACMITEITIGEHLGVIARCDDDRLQLITKETTKAHMMDETVHANIFRKLFEELYIHFTSTQKHFFNLHFPEVLSWFLVDNTDIWEKLYKPFKIPLIKEMLNDYKSDTKLSHKYNLSAIFELAEAFGMTDFEDKILSNLSSKIESKLTV